VGNFFFKIVFIVTI